ncbi:hypothetical protein IAD21_02254 [Abditibacteriota bacterium]|nr:hypothetical protein IAD21_02254 [Abditibacteriota bacterium]
MRLFSLSHLCIGAALCGSLFAPAIARADAFSPIPTGNPIYRQLDSIALLSDGKPLKPAANLTRYEAALQVARVAVVVTSKPEALSRSGWRSLRELTTSLKSELRQLGINVEDVLGECALQLDAPSRPLLPPPAPIRSTRINSNASIPSLLNPSSSPATLGVGRSTARSDVALPILGRARVEAALLALQRNAQDPLFTRSGALGVQSSATQFAGKDLSLAVDVNSWLRVRALSSQRRLGVGGDTPPALSSPLFNGAREASAFGGGLEVSPLSGFSISTNIERLGTDTGTRGTRVGGGIGLSAWQNRLTMSAHLSRLQPEDRAILPSTETELNLGVGVSQRLSLNLLYQGLFSSQSESSRLAGGLNFSF